MPHKPQEKRVCKAKSRVYGRDGWPLIGDDGRPLYKPCEAWAMKGLDVCATHGGMTPEARLKSARYSAEEEWKRRVGDLLEECDLPNLHPMDELLDVVRRSGAMVRLLGVMVSGLDLEPGYDIKVTGEGKDARLEEIRLDGLYGPNHSGDGAPHILVVMYGQWLDRHARACKLALDADIDDRMIRNAEATTDALFSAVAAALNAAELTHEQQDAFKTVLADELRKLAGPGAQPAIAAG